MEGETLTFRQEARAAAIAWKDASGALPEPARAPAAYSRRPGSSYPFCIPEGYASFNLLDDAREAIQLFERDAIAWHDDVNGGPSNHLLDSQVQCVNALAPFLHDSAALARLFGRVLDVDEVLPWVAGSEDDELVAFEWIGASNYLGERARGGGRRGANTTSADAAIRYRTSRGVTEVALIEWKYTEQYHGHELSGGEKSMAVRHGRYRSLYDALDAPVRHDVLPYEDLFVEPFYQLFRLTLLADQMERGEGAGRRAGPPRLRRAISKRRALDVAQPGLAPGTGRPTLRRSGRAFRRSHLVGDVRASRPIRLPRWRHLRGRRRADERSVSLSLRSRRRRGIDSADRSTSRPRRYPRGVGLPVGRAVLGRRVGGVASARVGSRG